MSSGHQPGAIPVWSLNGRPSASADSARVAEIERTRQMTPRERMERALMLGLQTRILQELARQPRDREP
jgi:hypothetical protein